MEGVGYGEVETASSSSQTQPLQTQQQQNLTPESPLPGHAEESWQQAAAMAAMAREAAALFQSRRYQDCLPILQQLLAKKENDPKVLHNIALTEFYQEGCTDPHKLLAVLAKVKGRSEELAQAADQQIEGIGNTLSSPAAAPNVKPTVSQGSGPAGDGAAFIEDYDTSIPVLNTAVILYHMQQYASAFSHLGPLYHNIEPIDETAALRICLLMLDIALASCQPGKAAEVLQYMEKAFGFGYFLSPTDGGNSQSQSLVVTQNQTSLSSPNTPTTESRSSNLPNATLAPLPSTDSLTQGSSEETFEEDALSIGLEIDGTHSVRSAASISRLPLVEKPPAAPATDLKLLLHLYKVRFLLLLRNFKMAKREVKSALNLSRDNLTALLLKAQLEYSRGNYRKAIKLLSTCSSRAEPTMTSMLLSNMGCINAQLGKDQTAAVFFLKALQNYMTVSKEKPLKLSTFSQNKSLSVLYNCGMVQLNSGNPVLAAHCFQEAAQLYYNRPALWLRLAECCILALEKGLLDVSEGGLPSKDELKISIVGDGKWRRVVLPTGSLNPTLGKAPWNGNLDDRSNQSNLGSCLKSHNLSMVFARQCLLNAMFLLDRSKKKSSGSLTESTLLETNDAEEQLPASIQNHDKVDAVSAAIVNADGDGKNGSTTAAAIFAYLEEQKKSEMDIRQCLLVDLAFVELCLENPLKALRYSENLLTQPECKIVYAYLGHVYAAEALCMLGRPKEAADHLSTCMVDCMDFDEDIHKWKGGESSEVGADGEDAVQSNLASQKNYRHLKFTSSQARATLYVNVASIHIMQREFSQARQCATQALAINPGDPLAILAMVYVDLSQGRSQEALAMLKRCRHLRVTRPQIS